MKVKNVGNKIVGFGNVFILPGEEAEINDCYKNSSAYKAYVELDLIAAVEEKAAAKSAKKTAEDKGE